MIIAIVLGGGFFATLYTNWLWFNSLDLGFIFGTALDSEIFLAAVATLTIFLFLFTNLRLTLHWLANLGGKTDPEVIQVDFGTGNRIPTARFGRDLARHPWFKRLVLGLSLAYALVNGLGYGSQWLEWQSFLNQVPYGMTDPTFGMDISFYLFSLPMLQTIFDTFFSLLLITIAIAAFLYFSNGAFDGSFNQRTPFRHLGILGAITFFVCAAGYQLDIFQLVYSSKGVAFGAGYSDIHALLPMYYVSIALSVICGLVMLTLLGKPRKRLLIITPLILIGFSFLGQEVYPGIIQSLQVTPNEFVMERPFVEHNIAYTRAAYGLDDIEEDDFPTGGVADWNELNEYRQSISNIPLLSYPQTQQAFTQLQGMRFYYRFVDVDVDRYRINGDLTQIMVAPRELDINSLKEADTWVNRFLKYTHGYGAVATPVKEFTPEGQPILLIKDIPPVSSYSELEITQPQIYFGELTKDYAIVGTQSREFDFPQSSDKNAENIYDGPDGIPLTSFWDQLLFSLRLGNANLLLTNEITPNTKVLLYRNIIDRVQQIAPFLTLDPDPYLVIDNGRLIWIIDGYTTSSYFPYSQPWQSTSRTVSNQRMNYIRNSVKITIDAYDGQPKFYLLDTEDPVALTYQKVFPNLFLPMEAMPDSLRTHLRYPEYLFTIQANMLLKYHMTDPGVFYNREDLWEYAKQTITGVPQPIEPYYSIMRFPDYPDEEFMIMLPLTPTTKDNMVAYLAGRSDGVHLGELYLYKFPKDRLVYGPSQIQARINQDARISQDLALWRQSGSSIEWGHMMTVPLKNSLLYINPLYIKSASSSLPELKRVVVSYGNTLVMEATLEAGLQRIFGQNPNGEVASPGAQTGTQTDVLPTLPATPSEGASSDNEVLIQNLVQQYARVQEAFRQGDWNGYGQAMSELERLIHQLEQNSVVSEVPMIPEIPEIPVTP